MAYSTDLRKRVLDFIEKVGYGPRKLGITRKKHSDISSTATSNVESIVKHSPRNTPLGNDNLC